MDAAGRLRRRAWHLWLGTHARCTGDARAGSTWNTWHALRIRRQHLPLLLNGLHVGLNVSPNQAGGVAA